MGNQSSVLDDMVYRVFPNLDPEKYRPEPQQQKGAAGELQQPAQAVGGVGGGGTGGQWPWEWSPGPSPRPENGGQPVQSYSQKSESGAEAVLSTSRSFKAGSDPASGRGPGSTSVGSNPSGTPNGQDVVAAAAAAAAARSRLNPRPMGMLAFEVAPLAVRSLDLWEQLSRDNVRALKARVKVNTPERFIFGSEDLQWRLAGVELRRELAVLTSALSGLAQRCSGGIVDEVQQHCFNVSRRRRKRSLFEEDEEDILMATLDGMVSKTGSLRDEMETLDDLMPSSHPLRGPQLFLDLLEGGSNKPGGQSPKRNGGVVDEVEGASSSPRSPKGSLANAQRRQRIVRMQLDKVQQLQKESLWSHDFDRTILLLSVALAILWHRFRVVFGKPRVEFQEVENTMGETGLYLHYANTMIFIDQLVSRPSMITQGKGRDDLYKKLPSSVKAGLRSRLHNAPVRFDADAVVELRRTADHLLSWMVPLAKRTLARESEQSFGCHSRIARRRRLLLVETMFYADTEQFELLLVELLVALSHTIGPKVRSQREQSASSSANAEDVQLPQPFRATLPRLESQQENPHSLGQSGPRPPPSRQRTKSRTGRSGSSGRSSSTSGSSKLVGSEDGDGHKSSRGGERPSSAGGGDGANVRNGDGGSTSGFGRSKSMTRGPRPMGASRPPPSGLQLMG